MKTLDNILADLIAFNTVTPEDNGVLEYVSNYLNGLGFTSHIQEFMSSDSPAVKNLYAYNANTPKLCFAGHLDVVPVGDLSAWTSDPFVLTKREDKLIGRGVVDMKGAVAAFLYAIQFTKTPVAVLLTLDEEGPAINGTVKMLEYIKQNELPMFTHAIVGEPTSEETVGDTIKVGRRGSLTAKIIINGVQGHVAYPHKALNPCDQMVRTLNDLKFAWTIDDGNDWFDKSNLEIVSIDVGNNVSNVIPNSITAVLNIRYNNEVTAGKLMQHISAVVAKCASDADVMFYEGAEPFISLDQKFAQQVSSIVCEVTGEMPKVSTSGGTSDARFISKYAKTIELGLRNETAHKIDEYCSVHELETLAEVYKLIFAMDERL